MFQRYIVNFWVWWYLVNVKELYKKILQSWFYMLAFTNVVPMIQNLFKPLYQDFTFVGRIIGFLIRIIWIALGTIAMVFVSIPLVFVFVLIVALPIIPIVMIILYFVL